MDDPTPILEDTVVEALRNLGGEAAIFIICDEVDRLVQERGVRIPLLCVFRVWKACQWSDHIAEDSADRFVFRLAE